jgi:hypothetical protein
VAVKGPADIWTTLVASREPAILARRLVDNPPHPDFTRNQEKPPSTTGAVGADPSRTRSYVARGSVSSSANCSACPRRRRHSASFPKIPRAVLVLGSTPRDTHRARRNRCRHSTRTSHKACLASRSPVREHRSGCARLHGNGARRRSATNRLRIHLPATTAAKTGRSAESLRWSWFVRQVEAGEHEAHGAAPFPPESQACSNQTCRSMTTPKQIAAR